MDGRGWEGYVARFSAKDHPRFFCIFTSSHFLFLDLLLKTAEVRHCSPSENVFGLKLVKLQDYEPYIEHLHSEEVPAPSELRLLSSPPSQDSSTIRSGSWYLCLRNPKRAFMSDLGSSVVTFFKKHFLK